MRSTRETIKILLLCAAVSLLPLLFAQPAYGGIFLSFRLLEAAKAGNTAKVERLLVKGANVNVKDEDGRTALMDAAKAGHTDIEELLKQAGAKE